MKVLLFTRYGGCTATPQMKEILNKYKGIRGRIGEIVDYVENNHVVYDASQYFDAQKEAKNNKELIIKISDVYIVWNENISSTAPFSIVEVDTTRPWTIEEYDGAEYIEYLDENKLVDEELNYHEKC
jgi:hypothetical protein